MAAHGEPHQQHDQIAMPSSRVERMLAAEDQRRAGDQALQLGEGDDRAGEGDGADRPCPAPSRSGCAILILPGAPMPKASGDTKAAAATNTAARPTSEWKAATSCGSAVIWMRRATTRADRAADHEAADDQPGRDDARRGHGDADRDHHADDAEEVAAARGHGRATARAAP